MRGTSVAPASNCSVPMNVAPIRDRGLHADALTDVATRIADALDKPLVLRPYEYDA